MYSASMGKRKPSRGIYQRGEIWWIRYSVRPGDMRYESTGLSGAEGFKAAEELLTARKKAIHDGRFHPERLDTTIEALVKAYLEHKEGEPEAKRITKLLAHIQKFFGANREVRSITHQDIRRWQRLYSIEKVRGRKPRGEHAVRLGLSRLRAMFAFGFRAKLLEADPFTGYEMPPPPPPRDRIASDSELERLKKAADRDMFDAIELAVETGMRRAEIVALEWVWIDLKGRIVRLPPHVTKTKKGRRVPLSERAVEALSWRHKTKPFDGLTKHALSKRFGYLVERLEIEDLHFHDLRRTAGVKMRRAGVDPFTIQRILGHAKIDMTSTVYQAFDDDDLRAAADKL